MSKTIYFFIFLLFGISSAHSNTKEINQEIDVLISLKNEVNFYFKANEASINSRLYCLKKYDLMNINSSEIKSKDLACFNVLNQLIQNISPLLRKSRILNSLSMTPLISLRDLGNATLIQKSKIISRKIKYNISLADSDLDLEKFSEFEPISLSEEKKALEIFENFVTSTCAVFEIQFKKQYLTNLQKDKFNFCDLLEKKNETAIQALPFGIYALKDFSILLKNKYEFSFRPNIKEQLDKLISTSPILTILSGPSRLKEDLKPAFEFILEASKRARAKLDKDSEDNQLEEYISFYRMGKLSDRDKSELLRNLKTYFDFQVISKYFSNSKNNLDQKTFENLKQEHYKKESFKHIAQGATVLALNIACFLPGEAIASKIAATGTKILFSQLTINAFRFLGGLEFKAICGLALLTPIQIYLMVDSVLLASQLHDLFFLSNDSSTEFTDFEKLSSAQSQKFVNILFLPLDGAIALSLIKDLPFTTKALYEAAEKFLKIKNYDNELSQLIRTNR